MSPDSGLTLLRPALLAVALVALPLLLIGLWGRAARRRERAALVAPRHGARFLPGHSEGRSLLRLVLAALALLFIGVSLAGPVRGWTMRNVSRRGLDLVVCIDTSRSMLVRDIRPDRLSRAIREVSGLIDRLAGDRVALIAFSGDAREVAPLTHDRTTLKELLKRVSPADNLKGGTDLGAALSAALAMFDGRTGAHEAVVLLTDGEDLTGNGLQVAETAAEQGIRVYVVGMGTEQGGKIPVTEGGTERFLADDEGAEIVSALSGSGLEEIARATGGEYLAATRSAAPLEELYQMRISRLDGRTIDGVEWVPHDRYQWALVLALLCMLVEAGLRERTGRSSGRGAVQLRSCALILALPLLGQGSQAFEALDEVRRLSLAEDHAAALEAGHAFGECVDLVVEPVGRCRLEHQAEPLGLAAGDPVAGKKHALGPFRSQPVDPHRRGRTTPDPHRHVADLRVLGHHDHVCAQRDVRAAGDREAVHLAQHRPVAAPQRHEQFRVAHHEGVILHRVPRHFLGHRVAVAAGCLGVVGEIVSGAEGASGAGKHDHVHARLVVCAGNAFGQFARQVVVDGVENLRPVERDTGDAPVLFIQNLGHPLLPAPLPFS